MQQDFPSKRFKNQLFKYSSLDASKNHEYLLKYFPKYYKTLSAQYQTFRKGSSLRKLKCIKQIDSFSFRFVPRGRKYLSLQLLQNKRRNLVAFQEITPPMVSYFPKISKLTLNLEDNQAWKGFLSVYKLKSLNLQYGIFMKKSKRIKGEIRFWTHLKKLKTLEHLSVNVCRNMDENIHKFMTTLDSCNSFIELLKTFKLQLSLSREYKIFGKSWTFKNIFKHVTELEIFDETTLSLVAILVHLDTFANLKDLKIEILRTTFQELYNALDFTSFQSLGSLNKLNSLFLAVSLDSRKCLVNFLRNLTLPASLTSVNIELTAVKWDTLIPKIADIVWKDENPFETDELCLDFYSRWAALKQLTSLTLAFSDIEGYFIPGAYFAAPLIKRLTGLTSLDYSSFYGLNPGGKKCLHMDYFWDAIDHLKPTLKTLIINDFAISIRDFNPNENEFPNLTSMSVSGFILGDTNIGSVMNSFNRHCKEDTRNYDLHIGQIIIDNQASWPVFLESLRKNSRRNLTVDLDVDIRKVDLAVLLRDLTAFVKEGRRAHGVYLYINNIARADELACRELQIAIKEHPVFEILQIRTREGVVLLDFQKEEGNKQYRKDLAALIQQGLDEDLPPFEPVEQFGEEDMNFVWEDEELEGAAEGEGEEDNAFFGEEDFREIEENF